MDLKVGSVWDKSCELFKKKWTILFTLELCVVAPIFIICSIGSVLNVLPVIQGMNGQNGEILEPSDPFKFMLIPTIFALLGLIVFFCVFVAKEKVLCDYVEKGELEIQKSISSLTPKVFLQYFLYFILVEVLAIVVCLVSAIPTIVAALIDERGLAFVLIFLVYIALFFVCIRMMFCQDILKGKSAIESMKHSFNMTKGNVISLIILGVMSYVCVLVGTMCCCIGYFAGLALMDLMRIVSYVHMSQDSASAETAQVSVAAETEENKSSIKLDKEPESDDKL